MATDFKYRETLNAIYDKLGVLVGFRPGALRITQPLSITEPLTLYVDTTGSDGNPGTEAQPLKTVQAAIEALRNLSIEAAVTIQVGAGTFAPFAVEGLSFGSGGTLTIQGTTTVLDSGTWTASSVTTGVNLTMTDDTKAWTVDALKGCIVESTTITSTTVDFCRAVVTNAATTISVPAASTTNFVSGAGYRVLRLDTVIAATASVTNAITLGHNAGAMAAQTGATSSLTTTPNYRLRLKFLEATTAALSSGRSVVALDTQAFVAGCRILAPLTGTMPTYFSASITYLMGCFLEHGGTISGASTGITLLGSSTQAISSVIAGCYLRKTGNVAGAWLGLGSATQVNAVCVEGAGVGLSVSRPISGSSTVTMWSINCTTAIDMNIAQGFTASGFLVTGATTGISVAEGGRVRLSSNINITATTGISVTKGAACSIASSGTITASTELSVDGVTETLANMRALTPKCFPATPNVYGSYIYE